MIVLGGAPRITIATHSGGRGRRFKSSHPDQAKIMRRVVRFLYLRQDPGDMNSLVNPDVVGELERALCR